jgi:hypothetical protein
MKFLLSKTDVIAVLLVVVVTGVAFFGIGWSEGKRANHDLILDQQTLIENLDQRIWDCLNLLGEKDCTE